MTLQVPEGTCCYNITVKVLEVDCKPVEASRIDALIERLADVAFAEFQDLHITIVGKPSRGGDECFCAEIKTMLADAKTEEEILAAVFGTIAEIRDRR